ncbi:hypothetical protein [Micromonospora rubida]
MERFRAGDDCSRVPVIAPGPWEALGSITPGPAGWFTIAVEAGAAGFRLEGRSLTAAELAGVVWRCPRWRGRPVLLVTQPSAPADGAGPVLRQFSVDLGAPVYASDAGVRFTFGRALADGLFWCWKPGAAGDAPEPAGRVLPPPGSVRAHQGPALGVRRRSEPQCPGRATVGAVAPPAPDPDPARPGLQRLAVPLVEIPRLDLGVRPVTLPTVETPRPDLGIQRPSITVATADTVTAVPPIAPIAPVAPVALGAPTGLELGGPQPAESPRPVVVTGFDLPAPRPVEPPRPAEPFLSMTAPGLGPSGPVAPIRLDPATMRLLRPVGAARAEPNGRGPVAVTRVERGPVAVTRVEPNERGQVGAARAEPNERGPVGAARAERGPVGAVRVERGPVGAARFEPNERRPVGGAARFEPDGHRPAESPWSPVRARTEDGDRERMRTTLGWKFQAHSRTVARALSMHPGLRSATGSHDVVAGLVAVLALLDGVGEQVNSVLRGAGMPDEDVRMLARCACAGLVQLPAVGAPVYRAAPAGLDVAALYRPGEVVVEPAFTEFSMTGGGAADAGPLYAIWSATARRLDQLRSPQESASRRGQAMFAAGSRFAVLGVEAAGPAGAPCVLLREMVLDRPDSALDERVARKLRDALAARPERVQTSTPLPWPLGFDAGNRRFATRPGPTGTDRPMPGRTAGDDGHDGA